MKMSMLTFGLLAVFGFSFAQATSRAEGADASSPQLIRSASNDGADVPSGRLLLRVPSNGDATADAPVVDKSTPPVEPSDPVVENDGGDFMDERIAGQNFLFILDLSGSMGNFWDGSIEDYDGNVMSNPTRLDVVRNQIIGMIRTFNENNSFDIIRFSGTYGDYPFTSAWRQELVAATPDIRQEAETYVQNMVPKLGTPTAHAFRLAFDCGYYSPDDLDAVVFLTDGAPTWRSCGFKAQPPQTEVTEYVVSRLAPQYEPFKAAGCAFKAFHIGLFNDDAVDFMQRATVVTDGEYFKK